jgi:hypothetical protein
VCQLSIIGQAFGVSIVNTHHFQAAGTQESSMTSDALAQAAGTTLANAWITTAKTAYLECVTMDYSMIMVRAQIIERPNQWRHRLTPSEVSSTGAGTAGASESAEDAFVSANLKWRTARAGKSYRGRTYFGPCAQGWRTNGTLNSQGVTALELYRDVMLNTWGANKAPASTTWVLTVYSRPYNKGEYGYVIGSGPNREFFYPDEYAGAATDIGVGAADPILRTQRRRQLGVGA